VGGPLSAYAPTMALFGWTTIPVMLETRREVRRISLVAMPVPTPKEASRWRRAITTSSSDVLPARSPMPLTVHSICRAPARTPASALAVAMPRSLWQWTDTTTSSMPLTCSNSPRMSEPNSSGYV
jgi:hypothetical protein